MAYFTQTEVSKWCCKEVFQFYQKNYPYYDLKQILDAINKDLKKFIDSSPNQEQKEQAQWIIDNYKKWTEPIKTLNKLAKINEQSAALQAQQHVQAMHKAIEQVDVIQESLVTNTQNVLKKHGREMCNELLSSPTPKKGRYELRSMSKSENKRTEFEKHASDRVSSFEYGVGQHPFSDCSPHDSEEDADDEYIEDVDKKLKSAEPLQDHANQPIIDQSNSHHYNKTSTKTKKTYVLKWSLATDLNPVVMKCQWLIDGTNITEAFYSYRELAKSMAIRKELKFAAHPAEILALNSIFLMEEKSNRAELDISEAIRAKAFQQMRNLYQKSRLPQAVENLCHQYVQAERELLKDDLDEELDNIYEELRKGLSVEEKKMLRVCREIWMHMTKNCGTSFSKTRSIEDTHVHHSIHPLLHPFFPDKPGITVEWANKTSTASTSRKAAQGHKPDFMILAKLTGVHEVETVFGLFKSPAKCAPSFCNVDLVDLGIMMKDSIDMYYKQGFELDMVTFGVHIFGYIARLYVMDLAFDGLYRMYNIGEFELPRSNLGLGLMECAMYEMMNFQKFVQETFRRIQSCTENAEGNNFCTPPKKLLMVRPTVATPEKVNLY